MLFRFQYIAAGSININTTFDLPYLNVMSARRMALV